MHTHHHSHKQQEKKGRMDRFLEPGLHKDWRTWLVIGLMLAALAIYVLTLDDSMLSGIVPPPGGATAAVR